MSEPANRCTICNVSWPAIARFQTCPTCKGQTWFEHDAVPLPTAEADVIVAMYEQNQNDLGEFDRYYDTWLAARRETLNKHFDTAVASLRADEAFMSNVRGLLAPEE